MWSVTYMRDGQAFTSPTLPLPSLFTLGFTFSNAKRRVSPAFRVERPVKAAMPAPGELLIFSMSRAMTNCVASHSPGVMEAPSRLECSPSTFESWYQASWELCIGRSGKMQRAAGHLEAPALAVRGAVGVPGVVLGPVGLPVPVQEGVDSSGAVVDVRAVATRR
jgi:hypothetical protein